MSLAYDDWKCTDDTAGDQAENDAKLEKEIEKLSDDLFDEYFDGNKMVITEVDEELVDAMEHVLESLRDGFSSNPSTVSDNYKRAVTLACRSVAHCIEDFKHLERFRRECDV